MKGLAKGHVKGLVKGLVKVLVKGLAKALVQRFVMDSPPTLLLSGLQVAVPPFSDMKLTDAVALDSEHS